MAVTDLNTEIEKTEKEEKKKYRLLELTNNLEEIRKMSDGTLKYSHELYPTLPQIEQWEIVPIVVMQFMLQYYNLIDSKKSTEKSVALRVGEFMTIGIEFGLTVEAAKDATFNPIITVGEELQYFNDAPAKNKLKKEPPVFTPEEQDQIDFICKNVQNTLKGKYSIVFQDYHDIERIVFCFFRVARQYLIDNRMEESYGLDIYIGNVLDIGISAYDSEEKGTQYVIQFAPGQTFKMDNAKGDDRTEK